MTVVSLLNSGADVQTKDKVYIFFSHLSSFVHHGAFCILAFLCSFVPYCGVIKINMQCFSQVHVQTGCT